MSDDDAAEADSAEEAEDADDEAEAEDEPAVELGDRTPVEGAPLARVTARLHFPLQRSEVERREGDATIRTPEGPRQVGDVLPETDVTYFATDDEFEAAVREVVGTGPVPTE